MKRLFTRILELSAAFALALLLTAAVARSYSPQRSTDAAFAQAGDAPYYWAITVGAEGKFAHVAPYVWRPGVPLLIRALPFPPDDAAQAVAGVATWAAGVAIYLMARAFKFSPALALVGLVLFYTFHYTAAWDLTAIWRIDGPLFVLIPLAFVAIKRRWDVTFMVLLLIGALVKETMLFVVPVWFTFNA